MQQDFTKKDSIKLIPKISSKWRLLYRPEKTGCYVNDHSLIRAHAPEIVCDDDGSWYITTCGWRNHGVPIEGGVAIANLEWMEEKYL